MAKISLLTRKRINQFKKKVIQTQRLKLRAFRGSDYESWKKAELAQGKPLSQWDHEPHSLSQVTKTKFKKILKIYNKQMNEDRIFRLGVFDRKSGLLYGKIDFYIISRAPLDWANLGYRIYNPYWGNGYASEAARASFRVAFDILGLHRVEAVASLKNKSSLRVANAIGMKKECIRKKFLRTGGRWESCQVFVQINSR